MPHYRTILALTAVVALTAAGCGGSAPTPPGLEKQSTVPVSGILTYKGKPVANASISFQALDGKVSARGSTDASGSFRLTSYTKDDGAPVGKYKVTAAAGGPKEIEPGVLEPEPPGGFKSPIPNKYANPATTDVIVEVKAGDKNEFTIDLK
jgi:hypothetical protein